MKTESTSKLAIVLPCFNEELALDHTIPELVKILNLLIAKGNIGADSFILCVDDGSRDNTWSKIRGFNSETAGMVKGLSLAHNRGHQFALLAGLMYAKDHADVAISIDADLQDDPKAIIEMVEKYLQGFDIVYGVRCSRKTDTWFKRKSAHLFYNLQRMLGLETVFDHSDYRLMSNRALRILSEYNESNLFLRGIIPNIGLKNDIVYYERNSRVAGESKYPLGKMLAFSVDGITSFSSKPIKLIFFVGFFLLMVDFIVAAYVFWSYFFSNVALGWSSIMLSIWFLGSLILMSLGIVGEYIGKIFIEVKGRPRFNVSEVIE